MNKANNQPNPQVSSKLGEWFTTIGSDKRTAFVRRLFSTLSRDSISKMMTRATELVSSPEKQKNFKQEVNRWISRTGNQELAAKVKQFFGFFTSDKITMVQKTIIAVVLLYVVTPIDFVPDAFPVLGWLDDLTLLSMAMNYIMEQMGLISGKQDEPSDTPAETLPEPEADEQ